MCIRDSDVPVSAACIIRELEHRGWELTKAQTLNGDNWEDLLFTLVPELRTMCGFQQNNPYHVYDVWTVSYTHLDVYKRQVPHHPVPPHTRSAVLLLRFLYGIRTTVSLSLIHI